MKKLFITATMVLSISVLNAQIVLSKWKFDTDSVQNVAGNSPNFVVGDAVADSGVLVTGSNFTGYHASASAAWTNPSGNGSPKSISTNNWAVNDYFQFSASTLGYAGISITFNQTGSNTGPSMFKVQYSTDGTNFTDFATYTVPTAVVNTSLTWNVTTFNSISQLSQDFSSINVLNNKSLIYFRLVQNGTTSINNTTVAATGTGRIDNFTIIASSPLPLSFKSFNASLINAQASLNWSTSNEINVNGFAIERSEDGTNYSNIGFVAAKNTANNLYSFNDAQVIKKATYYRLKITDKDGSSKYSAVVIVNTKQSPKLDIYPNPVVHTATVSHSKASERATIKVMMLDGKTLIQQNILMGATQSSVDVGRLIKGNYLIVYENDGVKTTVQMVKQ